MRGTYFCLDKNNFHKVANNLKGFLNRLNSAVEQSEYEQSDFYRKISKKLYEDGKIQIEYLKELIEEQTEYWIKPEEEIREIELHSLNREREHKFITKYEYNLKLNNIDETVKKQIKWRNELIDKLKLNKNDYLDILEYLHDIQYIKTIISKVDEEQVLKTILNLENTIYNMDNSKLMYCNNSTKCKNCDYIKECKY